MTERKIDLSLYLVTQREGLSGEAFRRVVLEAVAGGVSVVQLREKGVEADVLLRIARELLGILRPLGIPLIINDFVELALEVGADGVHLGQGDGSVCEAREILGPRAIIGLSVESLEQARLAEEMGVDYIAASPVFGTPTKVDTGEPWGLEGLRELCGLVRLPVVAIGGINLSNIEAVVEAGAAGVAVVSAIFNAQFPREAAEILLNKINETRREK